MARIDRVARIDRIVDIAAHLASGDAPAINFRQLAPAARTAPPPPLFLLGEASAPLYDELYGQFETGAVGCYSLRDAMVAPTGIAMKDGCAFNSPAFIHPSHHVATITARLAAAPLPMREVSGPLAVIYGPGHQTYGHWLADFLPRLWVLEACGHRLETLRFLVPRDLSALSLRLLERVGIAASQIVRYAYWQEIIHTDRLLMPTGLRHQNRMSPLFRQATEFWTARMIGHSILPPSRLGPKIMLSRRRAPQERALLNRDAIEAIARERGYAVVEPEALSLGEQMAMFSQARSIAGEYGSALHGSVFSPPGTVVCGLRGTSRHPSFVQSGIAAGLGQEVGYVLGATGGQEPAQRFRIDPVDFERALDVMELAMPAAQVPAPTARPPVVFSRQLHGLQMVPHPGAPIGRPFWIQTPATPLPSPQPNVAA